jgi:hypothetical protein
VGLIANVVANTPILSTWGNQIRDRTVMDFASVAERTAQWTAPPEGAHSFTRDTDTDWYYTGTTWLPVTGVPHESYAESDPSAFANPSTYTSNAYGNIPGSSCNLASFTKARADTKLIFHLCLSCAIDTAAVARFGVRFNNVDYDFVGASHVLNTPSGVRFHLAFMRQLTGIAAGTYTNTAARIKSDGSNGVSFYANADFVQLLVRETL